MRLPAAWYWRPRVLPPAVVLASRPRVHRRSAFHEPEYLILGPLFTKSVDLT